MCVYYLLYSCFAVSFPGQDIIVYFKVCLSLSQTLSPGVGDGQGGLACCSPRGCKESDTTERLNCTELNWVFTTKRGRRNESLFSLYVLFSQSSRIKLILISPSSQTGEFISIIRCLLYLQKNASWWLLEGEIQLGFVGVRAGAGPYPAIAVLRASLTPTLVLLVPAEPKESLSTPPGFSSHCSRKGSSRKWNLPGSWDFFLKETKHDLMKSRLILLFHFPFRKGGGRIVIWSIWFHICSRNYPRHKSTFLLSILKHPRELLLPEHPPRL